MVFEMQKSNAKRACTLHIDSLDFHSCVECDFFLHKVCANLPRKLDHALHNHLLVLGPSPSHEYNMDCLVCSREFTGFTYKCSKNDCGDESHIKFQVDVRCILVPDYFTHKSHQHPLFIPISTGDEMILCKGHVCSFLSTMYSMRVCYML